MDDDEQFVIIWGDLFDGLDIVGPFDDHDTALEYAESDRDIRDSHYWIKGLAKPAEDQ